MSRYVIIMTNSPIIIKLVSHRNHETSDGSVGSNVLSRSYKHHGGRAGSTGFWTGFIFGAGIKSVLLQPLEEKDWVTL